MAIFKFEGKISLPVPKINTKGQTDKMKAATKKALVRGMTKGASYVRQDLKLALDAAMASPVWAWPRVTQRQNGTEAGTTRDIIDVGTLAKSLKIVEKNAQTKTDISIQYSAPYAALVHYGGAVQPYGNRNAATVLIPGRPWIEAVLLGTHGQEKFDIDSRFQKGINEAWKEQFG